MGVLNPALSGSSFYPCSPFPMEHSFMEMRSRPSVWGRFFFSEQPASLSSSLKVQISASQRLHFLDVIK